MLTYQDLLAAGQSDKERMEFVEKVIKEHQQSQVYRRACDDQFYYDGENPTINKYEKIIYDQAGKAHVDMWTANHKIASQFFSFVVDQEVSYLLGNGVRFSKEGTKEKLGDLFDETTRDVVTAGLVGGTGFGFWNNDHLECFAITEFAPLYDEETGELKAGVRWWQIDPQKPLRATLFEPEGVTEYIKRQGEDMELLKDRQSYKRTVTVSQADGVTISDGGNYDGFPVVPMYGNKARKGELNGKRNTIDALDLAMSGMVNNVDEGNLIYWVLTNCGGMDDLDDAKFIERLKTTHVSHADGEAGAQATAHSIEAPFEGTQTTIDMLLRRLYADFQAFDVSSVTASNQSATAIKASYIPLDLKCDKLESQVTRFITAVLKLAGIDDKPTYERNQLINRQEETQTLTMQAQYFDDEYIRKKLLALNGDLDQYDEISKRMDAEDADRLKRAKERLREAQNIQGKGEEGTEA